MLPNDPNMLLSLINTKLRDYYDSIEKLCDDLELDQDALEAKLSTIGYYYVAERHQFLSREN